MRVLLLGASGFLGAALLRRLHSAGHTVVCVARHPPPDEERVHGVALDLGTLTQAAAWTPLLDGVHAVVNTVGLFRERAGQTFETLHVRMPCALFEACVRAGVHRVVQVSALGADDRAPTAYWRSKAAADQVLLALPLAGVVVRPSLVFGVEGASARLMLGLAALPLLPLAAGGRQVVQPLHVDDAAQALQRLVEDPARCGVVALVGPAALTLADYLQALRQGLGLGRARTVQVPAAWVAKAAAAGAHRPDSLLDPDSWTMLQHGPNAAPADDTAALLGHAPRPVARFITPAQAQALRAEAQARWTVPLLRLALAALWLATAAVSAGLYPVADSLALLGRAGVPPAWQPLMLYGAAAVNALLGALTLWPLRARWRRRLWGAQALLVLGYSAIITLRLPEYWLHPYGPMTKNLVVLAVLAVLHAADGTRDSGHPRKAA